MNMTSSLCEDVDECADEDTGRCGEFGTCENTVGGFECICDEGFENSKGKSSQKDARKFFIYHSLSVLVTKAS